MIHGPCSTKTCYDLVKKACKKKFPRDFVKKTVVHNNSVTLYRRRKPSDGGYKETIKKREIDNGWVVPYNPYLLRKYGCHINVEHVDTCHVCKYLYKVSFMFSIFPCKFNLHLILFCSTSQRARTRSLSP